MKTQTITLQVPDDATLGLFINERQRQLLELAVRELNGLRFSPAPGLFRSTGVSIADDTELGGLIDMLTTSSPVQINAIDCTKKGES
jgi:hypothetical protein